MHSEVFNMSHIGGNLRRIRDNVKLSQQELAEKSGISKAQISRIENGTQTNPSIQTVISLATALNTTMEEIIFGEESGSVNFLNEAIKRLPEDEQKAIKKMIKIWVLTNESEKWKDA